MFPRGSTSPKGQAMKWRRHRDHPKKKRGRRPSHETPQASSPLKKRGEAKGRASSPSEKHLGKSKRPGHEIPQAPGTSAKEARPEAERRDAAGVESTQKKRRGQSQSHETLQASSPSDKHLGKSKRPGHEMAQARGSPEKEARPEAERRDAAGIESTEKRGDVKKS